MYLPRPDLDIENVVSRAWNQRLSATLGNTKTTQTTHQPLLFLSFAQLQNVICDVFDLLGRHVKLPEEASVLHWQELIGLDLSEDCCRPYHIDGVLRVEYLGCFCEYLLADAEYRKVEFVAAVERNVLHDSESFLSSSHQRLAIDVISDFAGKM